MNQLPVHLQNRQRRDLVGAALGGLNTGSPPHISIAGNRFTLVDDAGNEKPVNTLNLDVCVIDANPVVSKVYFDENKPFVQGEDNSGPPICWSDNGIGASAQATQPQNTSCQLCPKNAWKSKGNGKLCADVKKLAVIVPGVDMVFLLRIPPASLKNLAKYTQTLAGHGVDLPDALTRLEFESQGILKFTPVGYVDEATATATDKVIAAKATDILIGRNDRAWGGQADAQKAAYAQQQERPAIEQAKPAAQPMAPPPQPFGGQVATPFGGGASTAAPPSTEQAQPFTPHGARGVSPSDPFAQPSTSSPTDVTPPKRGRGPNKPKAESAPAEDGIPPFLQRNPPAAAAPAPNPTQFGMQQNPPAPDAGITAALDAAFRLPT
jgi:hypothetical protein